jgi:hypothetical protein
VPWLLPVTGTGWRPAPHARPGDSRAAGGRSEASRFMPAARSPAQRRSPAGPGPWIGGLPPLADAAGRRAGRPSPGPRGRPARLRLSGDPGRVLDVIEHGRPPGRLAKRGRPAIRGGAWQLLRLPGRHRAGRVPSRPGRRPGSGRPDHGSVGPHRARQILRWLCDTVREDPLQLPILVRDVGDAGPHGVVGTLAMPCATRSRTSFPSSRCRCWSPGAAANPSCRRAGRRPPPDSRQPWPPSSCAGPGWGCWRRCRASAI